jgi:hypothetical protein
MLFLPSTQRRLRRLALAALCAGLAACNDKSITSYRVPKEPDAAQAPAPDAAAPSGSPAISWTAPSGWQTQPASGMRQGSFLVPGAGGATADMSVVSFPGTGGDDLANINRWRAQVSLPPIAAADLPSQVQNLAAPAGQFVLADFAGTAADKGATRLLGAWLRQPDRVWFFKLMGPADLVESQKEAFTGFLQSVTLAAGGAPVAVNTNDLPQAGPAVQPPFAGPAGAGMTSMPVQAASGASLLWQAPADWQNQPGNAMRKGSYALGGGAEVAITAFPGDVGGVLANVNRWRGQAGLAPVDDAGLAQATSALDSNGMHFTLVDAEGGSNPIVAALLPWNGGTWFFKLTGPVDAVTRAKPAFLSFLGTVHAP